MPAADSDVPTGRNPLPEAFRVAVSALLGDFVADQRRGLAAVGSDLDPFLDAAERSLQGGKRLRPGFVYWGWRAAGGSRSKTVEIMRAGAAVELVHASALVHDDVLDASSSRRGVATAQRAFAAMTAGTAAANDRFGTNAAILLGDLLLGWSDELYCNCGFKPKALRRGRPAFDRLRAEVVVGQYLDVLAQTKPRISGPDAMRIVRYKSAKYTVERPLQLGAALAGGAPELLAALASYAVPLGEAFQLRDDVLGVFGEQHVTGKPIGDDIREGKQTLLVSRALDKSDARQRKVLDTYFGNPMVGADGIAAVQEVLRDSGALAAVETVIAELTSAALAALAAAPAEDDEAIAALRTLSEHVTKRTA